MNPLIDELEKVYGNGRKAQLLMILQTLFILLIPMIAIYTVQTIDSLVIILALLGLWLINWIGSMLRDMKDTVQMERLEANGLKIQIVKEDRK
jgi:hypothetical protein